MTYIDKEELIEEMMADGQEAHSTQWFVEKLVSSPAADVRENVWADFEVEWGGMFLRHLKCGNCESRFDERTDWPYNVCPYCGARRKSHA